MWHQHIGSKRLAPTAAPALALCSGAGPIQSWMPLHSLLRSYSSQAKSQTQTEEQVLRWPLPPEELVRNSELSRAVIEDDRAKRQLGEAGSIINNDVPFGQKVHPRHGGFVKPPKKRRVMARPPPPPRGKSESLTSLTPDDVAQILVQSHAQDVVVIDVSKRCDFADSMVICTGQSIMHVRSLSHAVLTEMKGSRRSKFQLLKEAADDDPEYEVARSPFSLEGDSSSDWSIVDAGSMVVHVLTDDARHDYNLEALWAPDGQMKRIEAMQPAVQTLQTMRIVDGQFL